jgi:hypothetical protein
MNNHNSIIYNSQKDGSNSNIRSASKASSGIVISTKKEQSLDAYCTWMHPENITLNERSQIHIAYSAPYSFM